MSAPALATPATTDPALPYHHPVRVYWEDTDAGGVVFYANYLKFFERARTEWLRQRGVSQQHLKDSTGAMFVVTDTNWSNRGAPRSSSSNRPCARANC